MNENHFKKNFQFQILKGLRQRTSRFDTNEVTGRIPINQTVYNSLKEQGVTGRFSPCIDFTYGFILRSTKSNGDLFFTPAEDLQVRIQKESRLEANGQNWNSGHCSFSFKFLRHFNRN
jgi:hypothetical protein